MLPTLPTAPVHTGQEEPQGVARARDVCDGLLPEDAPLGPIRVDHELPPQAVAWKRILDLRSLEAGDLLLFRNVSGDTKDKLGGAVIVSTQTKEGFPPRHAQWTHAAVYLGDDEHICEANFGLPNVKSGVILRSVFQYCDGHNAVRARRPKNMTSKQRLRIAIGALTNLGKDYDFAQLARLGLKAAGPKRAWYSSSRDKRIEAHAFVCSTLYQDAFNFASRGTIRYGALATPAKLSASDDFEPVDPSIGWLTLE